MTRGKRSASAAGIDKRVADRAQARDTPSCFQAAEFDAEGYLLPQASAIETMLEVGLAREAEIAQRTEEECRHLMEPSRAWPCGKERLVHERLALATGSTDGHRRLAIEMRAAGFDLATIDQSAVDRMPAALRLQLIAFASLVPEPTRLTQDALAVFHPTALYALLALDPPVDSREKGAERGSNGRVEVDDLAAFERLLPVLRSLAMRLMAPEELRNTLTLFHKLLNARATIAVTRATKRAASEKRRRSLIAVSQNGWTTAGVEHRRDKLRRLTQGLRGAEPEAWPMRRIVELVLVAGSDWKICPCPQLVARYTGRKDELLDLMKKDLRRRG